MQLGSPAWSWRYLQLLYHSTDHTRDPARASHGVCVFNKYLLSESLPTPNTKLCPAATPGANAPGCPLHVGTFLLCPFFPQMRECAPSIRGCSNQHYCGHQEPCVPPPLIILWPQQLLFSCSVCKEKKRRMGGRLVSSEVSFSRESM